MATILVADEIGRLREALVRMVERMGHHAVAASSEDDLSRLGWALRTAGSRLDLVVIDYHFQGGPNALELLTSLGIREFAHRVILLAGDRDVFENEEAYRLGVFRVLRKPIDEESLREAIAAALAAPDA